MLSGQSSDIRIPVRISLAASTITSGVSKFKVPSSSFGPNRPQAFPRGPLGSSGRDSKGITLSFSVDMIDESRSYRIQTRKGCGGLLRALHSKYTTTRHSQQACLGLSLCSSPELSPLIALIPPRPHHLRSPPRIYIRDLHT